MNPWLLAAAVLMAGLVPCGVVLVREDLPDRLVAVELGGTLSVLILLLLAQGFGRPTFYDLALTLAFLSLPASLVFARVLERWL